MTTINIAAVGDILMWKSQINAAKRKNKEYSFANMFKEVTPYLKKADLTIGNFETTLSGDAYPYFRRNPKTKYPMFNCPDQLASTLKNVGFDVVTTANNHCMDCGMDGLKRTLNVLDKEGIKHTGTYRTAQEARTDVVVKVKGIEVGILAYTYGTNFIPVPKDKLWAVNRIQLPKIERDVKRLKRMSDLVIVALHFGKEFYRYPSDKQKEVVKEVFKYGADIILGCHPHVLQPIYFYKKGMGSKNSNQLVIYSLGNFISKKMLNNRHSDQALILTIQVNKDRNGRVNVRGYKYIPTYVHERKVDGRKSYRVLPIKKFLNKLDKLINKQDQQNLEQAWKNITSHIRGIAE